MGKKWGIILNQIHPDINWKEDSHQMLMRFRMRKLKRILDRNLLKIKEAEIKKDDEEVMLYLRLHHRIKSVHDELAKQIKLVIG